MNSETDFVARNELFRDCLNVLTSSALDAVQAGAATDSALEALKSAATADLETKQATTVGDAVTAVAAKMGENLVLRRTTKLTAENGLVATCVSPSHLQRSAAVQALHANPLLTDTSTTPHILARVRSVSRLPLGVPLSTLATRRPAMV